MPPAPTLPDELLEEIFLRLPPDEPEWLVRASLASKHWLGLLVAPSFHVRYSEFHGDPPMLGFFLHNFVSGEDPLFSSTTKFRACIPDPGNRWYPWDCRHGRVLLGRSNDSPSGLAISDPITDCQRELDAPGCHDSFGAAVLCAVNGCDHHACHGGPSRVVFVGLDADADAAGSVAYAYESLLETAQRSNTHSHLRQWSNPCSGLYLGHDACIEPEPPVLIQDTLYFKLAYNDDDDDDDYDGAGILKYDLCSKCLSVIDAPVAPVVGINNVPILMGMEDGSLGFAHLDGLYLNLWSRQMGSDGAGSWTKRRVIDLSELLSGSKIRIGPVGSVEGRDIIFMATKLGIYKINLKSPEWKSICAKENFLALIPYMSFYYPQGRVNPCDAAH